MRFRTSNLIAGVCVACRRAAVLLIGIAGVLASAELGAQQRPRGLLSREISHSARPEFSARTTGQHASYDSELSNVRQSSSSASTEIAPSKARYLSLESCERGTPPVPPRDAPAPIKRAPYIVRGAVAGAALGAVAMTVSLLRCNECHPTSAAVAFGAAGGAMGGSLGGLLIHTIVSARRND